MASMRDYAFDVTLTATVTVPGASRAAAARTLRDVLECADANLGTLPGGDPILCEASLDPRHPPVPAGGGDG